MSGERIRWVFVLKLGPLPGVDAIRELRQAAERRYRLRCISVSEERDEP
jgi:hypothetical protein